MKIGEVALRAGVKASALRFYEQAGLLPAPERASGRRVYDEDVLDRLAVLQFAQACGFRLSEARELLGPLFTSEPVSARWRRLARAKIDELDQLIVQAKTMKAQLAKVLACRCPDVAQCGRRIRNAGRRRRSPTPARRP